MDSIFAIVFWGRTANRTQEVWTRFTATNFSNFRISKYRQKWHMPLHTSFYIKKASEEVKKTCVIFFLFNYPMLFIFSSACCCAALQQGYDKSFCFPLQQFCATSLLSADSLDLAFDPPGIRQKDCPIIKRQTTILRDRIPLCEVPVAYWIKQSGKVFS